MRYFVTIGERTFEVDLTADDPVVNGRHVDAELVTRGDTPLHHVCIDHRATRLVARRTDRDHEWELRLGGAPIRAEVLDERTRAIRAMTGSGGRAQGPGSLRAPMPGLVVSVEVEEGELVTAGQGVVIMEAMKMENELKAEAPGRVARIQVGPGDAVDKGAVLVEFDSE